MFVGLKKCRLIMFCGCEVNDVMVFMFSVDVLFVRMVLGL